MRTMTVENDVLRIQFHPGELLTGLVDSNALVKTIILQDTPWGMCMVEVECDRVEDGGLFGFPSNTVAIYDERKADE